jgi:acetylornithine deacetylase
VPLEDSAPGEPEGSTMIEIDREVLSDAIAELVRIPSVNPSLVSGAVGEREIAEAIADRLRRTPGIEVELQESGEGRPNVIATVGDGPGRTLMLNGHTDTVGVAGMDEPFSGRIEGNRLYGRGSADMKGADAGLIVLLEAVARAGDFPGRLVATFVTDEEHSSIGTQAICRAIERWRPDAAVIVEGSDLEVVVAHKGFAWATIETHGFAAHGSRFELGRDAIFLMGRVVSRLEELNRELLRRAPHPLVGPPSLHASLISGGQELSSYPESCRLELERRTIPGDTEEQVRQELRAILDELAGMDDEFAASLEMGVFREPFEIATDAEIVGVLRQAIREARGREPHVLGAAGWMDSALLARVGVPTVIFGPSGSGAHGLVEWVDLDSVEAYVQILARVSYDFCAAT